MANPYDQFLPDATPDAQTAPSPAPTARMTGKPADFASTYGDAAKRAGDQLGVDPSVLLGQWGHETGWGKSVIPGTNNLGNIKDFTGGGVAATDNMNGSRDKYRAFATPDEFADHYVGLIGRKYPDAIGAGADAGKFAGALAAGGYAEDPNYVAKVQAAAGTAAKAANPVLRAANAVTDAVMPAAQAATQANPYDQFISQAPKQASAAAEPNPYDQFLPPNKSSQPQTAAAGGRQDTTANPFNIGAAPPADPQKNLSWSAVPGAALKNLPSSAGHFIGGIYDAVTHPIDTASNLVDIAAGSLNKVLPAGVIKLAESINPDYATKIQGAEQKADAVGAFYKDRYGSMDGFKNAVATDPVGILSDAATVVGGGAGLAVKGAGAAGLPRIADLAAKVGAAGDAINPVNIGANVAKAGLAIPEFVGSHALGTTTQVGANTIRDAAKAGFAGDSSFLDNLSGKANMTDVLDAAKQNLQAMGAQKAAAYRAGMAQVSADKSILGFNDIDQAVQKADALGKYKGQVKNPQATQAVSSIADEINNWKTLNPADFHTPEGMDALKQRIGGILEDIPYEQRTARTAAGGIYNAVKTSIADQAPVYADVMKGYSDSSELISQIEKSLSLNPKASVDTALRKLQSLSRNNANTNFGYRKGLADTLQEQGGQNLAPSLAGQAMNSWTPRGLLGGGEVLAALGTAFHTGGASLAALPLASPKLAGYGLYGAGRIAGIGQAAASKVPLSAGAINLVGQAGNLKQRAERPGYADGGMIGDDDAAAQAQYQGAVSAQQAQQQSADATASAAATTRGNEKIGLKSMGYSDDEVQGLGYANGGMISPDPYAVSPGMDVSPGLDVPNEIPDVPRIARGADFQSKVASSLAKNNGAFINAAGQPDNYNSYNLSSLGLAPNAINSSPVASIMNNSSGIDAGSTVHSLMSESAFNQGGGSKIFRGFANGGVIGGHRKASAIRALAFGTPTAVNPRPGKGKSKVPRIADMA